MPKESHERPHVILFLGIPGVGKTSLLLEAYNLARKSGRHILIVTFSDVMLKRAQSEGLVSHRDEMRRLPTHVQLRLQKEAASEIASMAADRIVLVDTHALIRVGEGAYLPGVPSWIAETLAPTQVIHVEASPEEIRNRRSLDRSDRRRDVEKIEDIALHLNLSRIAALVIASHTGAYLRIINNREGRLASTAATLKEEILTRGR